MLQIHQDTLLLSNLDDVRILKAVQVGLGDADVLMAQKPGDGVQVGSQLDLLLCEEMAAGVRGYPDALDAFAVAFDDMLHGPVGQLPSVIGEKVVIIGGFQIKVAPAHSIIAGQCLAKNGRDGNHPLFVVFAVNDNKILVQVVGLNTAKLPAADPCLKEERENCLISYRQKPIAIAGGQHLAHMDGLEGGNDGLLLLAPTEVFLRVEAAVALLIAILDEGFCGFQQTIDVGSLLAPFYHVQREFADSSQRQILHVIDFGLLGQIAHEQIQIVAVASDGLRCVLADFNFQQVFGQCVFQ